MSIYRRARSLAWAAAFVFSAGCQDLAEEDDALAASDTAADVQLGVREQAIRDGTTGGGSGQVEILTLSANGGVGGCTGSMVSKYGVLTAAHCFDGALGTRLSGSVELQINYTRNGTDWVCITDAQQIWSDGKCAEWDTFSVTRLQSGWDAKNDLAFIRSSLPWWGVGPADSIAFYYMNNSPSNGEPVVSWGSGYFHYNGTGDGTMRWMNERIDSFQGSYYVMDAGNVRICQGDSGGADVLTRNGVKYVIGVHSNAELSSHCAKVGGKQRSTNVNAHGTFIREQIRIANGGWNPCSGWGSGLHCWEN